MSCARTRAVLDQAGARIGEERSSRQSPMTDAEARALLKSVDLVIVARGKSSRTIPAPEARPDDLRGPTGGIRAPIVKKGKTLLVGFSETELKRLLR